ncbi:Nsp1-like C-terminal region-domain-containing protein [Xylariaceae sp. FL1651]|nr:Nsp1-like C-terminal region-domain-containing protein [Xylariaceae sp. FL1651]
MSFSFGTPSSSGQPNNNATASAPASSGLFGSSVASTPSGGLFGGQSNSTPSFSFGNAGSGSNGATAGSAGTSGGGLFGNAGSKPAEQKPIFGTMNSGNAGSSASTPSGGGSGLFGGSSQTASSNTLFGGGNKPATTGSLFGNTSSTPASTAASTTPTTTGAFPAGGLFGSQDNKIPTQANQGPSTNKPGGLFGGNSASTGNSLFGGANSSNTPASSTPLSAAQATPAKPLFALNSTTPAGAPPSQASKPSGGLGLFGNSGAQNGSSLFASSAQPSDKKENQTNSMFANPGNSQTTASATQPVASVSATPSLLSPAGQAPKPAGSLFGSTKPAEASTTTKSIFGAKPEATQGASASMSAPTAKPASSLFGGTSASTTPSASTPSLFNTASAAPTASTSAPAPAATQTKSLFADSKKPTSSTSVSEPPKPTNLFGSATPSANTTASSAPASSTTGITATTTAPATNSVFGNAPKVTTTDTTLGASTSGPTSSMARLKNRTMDEILNRWATDLSKYQKDFKEQASQTAAWDRLLVENGEKIQKFREVERHLVTVESQQEELESWLDKYEVELAGPDQERERTYKLAEKITERLDEMGRDLSKMIKEINDISGTVSKGSKPDDPLSQIVRVLNGHLTQLQWIDTNAAALQAKVTAAQKASSQIGSQYGGPEQDNVDSFYRSYMGRR